MTIVAAATVPEPGWGHVLTAWTFQPLVLVPLVAAAWLYLAGVRRVGERYPLVVAPFAPAFAAAFGSFPSRRCSC